VGQFEGWDGHAALESRARCASDHQTVPTPESGFCSGGGGTSGVSFGPEASSDDSFFPDGHEGDLFQFRSLYPKKCGHFYDLAGVHEIVRIGTETFQAGVKLATTHSLRDIESELTFAVFPVM